MPVVDSGNRVTFESGATRDIQPGKGRPSLLPGWALIEVSKHFEDGAVKYGENNWTKGIPMSSFFDSAFRHMMSWKAGKTDEDHLRAACWNMLCALDTRERIKLGLLPESLDNLEYPLKTIKEENSDGI